jgi:hypothetical protein
MKGNIAPQSRRERKENLIKITITGTRLMRGQGVFFYYY